MAIGRRANWSMHALSGHLDICVEARPTWLMIMLPRPPTPVSRRLRFTDTRTLVVSRRALYFGDRAIGAAGPRVWNNLSIDGPIDRWACHAAGIDSQ